MTLSYRLFFTTLFLLLGISAVGIVLLEQYAGISIIITELALDKKSLLATLSIMAILSITTAFILGSMLLNIRFNISLFYFRLFFIALFLLLGVSTAGTVVLEQYAGMKIIITESAIDKKALHVALSIMGILGTSTAFIMIYLMREKRDSSPDRRQQSMPIDFTDRRTNIDRRTE